MLCAVAALGLGLAAPARADDALPGDLIALPPDTNVLIYYNAFVHAGAIGPAHGDGYSKGTRISLDIQALRYIHTFNVQGVLAGVQVYQPYATFLGGQHVGIADIPGVPGGPSYGPGQAALSHASGFGQPSFGAFIFPVNNPQTGTYVVTGIWAAPPLGGYDRNAALNYDQNLPMGEFEAGFRTTLLGRPDGYNLSLEIWSENYVFGSNNDAGIVSPAVYADNIPPIYAVYNQESGGLVPDSNPLRAQSVGSARLNEQPSEELRVYLPYQFIPATRATIAPGLFQSFGGKQTYTLANGAKIDSGNRTNETQLRLVLSTFLTPHWQVLVAGDYDLASRGGPLDRNVEIRIATAF